jgi:coenzyme PQQ precursor peptide PqqA
MSRHPRPLTRFASASQRGIDSAAEQHGQPEREETIMAWTAPILVEVCIGLEINGYLPAEF